MTTVKVFEFNPISVNTYIIYDETGECAIIDPGCHGSKEEKELSAFIDDENLKPVRLLITHAHTDHILGINYVINKYSLIPEIHKAGKYFLDNASSWATMLGFDLNEIKSPFIEFNDGDILKFGNTELLVAYTPGHADGSVCFINKKEKFVVTGDVLFSGSIGRTDLPTGDFKVLEKSIKDKLYTLDNDFKVYAGHGPATNIGIEKQFNPFVHL